MLAFTLKVRFPVVWRLSVTLGIVFRLLPDVPVSILVILGATRVLEPLMLVTCMIHNKVKNQLHPPFMEFVFQHIDIID